MRLIREDKLLELDARVFYETLLEYLSKNDPIKKANYYWQLEHPKGKFNPKFMRAYAKQFPIADIKDDILGFVVDFANEMKSNPDIDRILSYKSPDFGFSNYIHIYFKKPTDTKLANYVANNDKKYSNVKFRFSEHEEYEDEKEERKSVKNIDLYNKNFIQAAQEMKSVILSYIADLRSGEQEYLNNINTVATSKQECIKLRIRESVSLDERLEEIGYSTYMTDLTSDIVNWLLNKPKPYRVLYDSMYDVWSIADATATTHKDMSIDMFDSNYLYNIARDLDSDIEVMRNDGNFNSGYTDAEVYSDYLFDNGYLTGLIFIPSGDDYFKYEDTGFYPNKTEITTGTIFTKFALEDRFKSLYKKLKIADVIVRDETTLQDIWDSTKNQVPRWYAFSERAADSGFSYDQIDEFLDSIGETRHRGITGGK